MRVEGRDGQVYVSASDIRNCDGYGDVTPALLRSWAAAGRITAVTVGELVAALNRPLPPGTNPDHPARVPGAGGRENVYRWADVVRAETAGRQTRRQRGGRPRAAAPALP